MRDYIKHTKCLYYCRETDPRGGGGGIGRLVVAGILSAT